MKSSLLDATCRVAFAGLIHDLGKFAQRARIDASEASIKLHQQMYCPRRQAGDRIWWTHQHAAYTALAFPVIEKVAPALIGEKAFPFSEGDGECQDFCVWGGYSRGSPTRLPFVFEMQYARPDAIAGAKVEGPARSAGGSSLAPAIARREAAGALAREV